MDLTNFSSVSFAADNDQAGASLVMTKLAESMTKQQAAALKAQEEKGGSHLKAWKKLPTIQQYIILLGGVEEDGTVPTDATDEILCILGYQNGAQVDQYRWETMQGHNMTLEPGMCISLNKGILVSPDDVNTPKNLTPFLTPPVKDDEDFEEIENLLKLAVKENTNRST